mmetsp:Transcript_20714/g.62421  ORF Transcript_20714/g.62421 Transcript_20714/m.62421 type:complete len:282 (+) Transcript_20714:724-1569(+)
MARQHVADFMGQHRRQLVVATQQLQHGRVHHHLATWHHEGIGLLAVYDHELPLQTLHVPLEAAPSGAVRGDGSNAAPNALHPRLCRRPPRQQGPLFLSFLQYLLEGSYACCNLNSGRYQNGVHTVCVGHLLPGGPPHHHRTRHHNCNDLILILCKQTSRTRSFPEVLVAPAVGKAAKTPQLLSSGSCFGATLQGVQWRHSLPGSGHPPGACDTYGDALLSNLPGESPQRPICRAVGRGVACTAQKCCASPPEHAAATVLHAQPLVCTGVASNCSIVCIGTG